MPPLSSYRSCVVETPIGSAVLAFSDVGLVALAIGAPETAVERLAHDHGVICEVDPSCTDEASRQFDEYFAGQRRVFDFDLDWRLTHGFARDALRAVCDIPYGETASYGEIAALAGRPRAARAVGTACRTTPFSLVVPVHRVVRADGSLGEYGGNEDAKRYLVELELENAP
ncbi:methylated-DNA--[protein]-cysteine S-methyltransferase [Microbacterium halotolerans]|uniref:methylated-DNA--[protein]-cysteine S-methyltransferase n=1 Tax=Microbacterium halotolerans TaxID=246613 RepID=UPI000E6AA3A2|nr:methylated-DNA--[protein]-cysteine S-methyltransferase [Microbacterium halotolerans]